MSHYVLYNVLYCKATFYNHVKMQFKCKVDIQQNARIYQSSESARLVRLNALTLYISADITIIHLYVTVHIHTYIYI